MYVCISIKVGIFNFHAVKYILIKTLYSVVSLLKVLIVLVVKITIHLTTSGLHT